MENLHSGGVNGSSRKGMKSPKVPSLHLDALVRKQEDEIVLKPFEHVNNVPSKYHKRMLEVFNYWLKVPEDKLKELKEILQILHTATLLIDDIQDDSTIRYGIPAAHVVHGVGLTLNAACQVFHIALRKTVALGKPTAINNYLEIVEDILRGQGIELYWRDNFQCPTEAEYVDMLKQKTAALFVLYVQLLQEYSDNKENYINIAILIGIYYAIRDDYCNLFNRAGIKTLTENPVDKQLNGDSDITDGKFTMPIIHALQLPGAGHEIIQILKQHTSDQKLIDRVISLLREKGSDVYTEQMLLRLEKDIDKEIIRLGGNPDLTALVMELRNWRNSEERK